MDDHRLPRELAPLLDVERVRSTANAVYRHSIICDLQVERVRFRPAERAIVSYRAILRTEESDEQRTWLLAHYHSQKPANRRVRRLVHQAECGGMTPDAVIVLDDHSVLQQFPLDSRLVQLPLVAGTVPRDVREVLRNHYGWRDANLLGVARYRPGIGATLVYGHRKNRAYAKYYVPGQAARAYRDYAQLRGRLQRAGLDAPAALLGIADHDGVLFEAAGGEDLASLLRQGSLDRRHVEIAAEALARLHSAPIDLPRKRGGRELLMRFEKGRRFMVAFLPDTADHLDSIGRLLHTLATPQLRPAHCDMKAEHVFVAGDRAALIDLDSMSMSHPFTDPAMLALRLCHLSPNPAAPRLARHLLDCYSRCMGVQAPVTMAAHLALGAARIALYETAHRQPGWPRRARILLEQAVDLLHQPDGHFPGTGIFHSSSEHGNDKRIAS